MGMRKDRTKIDRHTKRDRLTAKRDGLTDK